MQISVPKKIIRQLRRELRASGVREIGGMLFAEHVGGDDFRLHSITVQTSGGTTTCFRRDPALHVPELARLHAETGNDFLRFNYLGEWHSHPSFAAHPSPQDFRQMLEIANDPDHPLPQAVLLIVRLENRRLEMHASLYRTGDMPREVELSCEGSSGKSAKIRASGTEP